MNPNKNKYLSYDVKMAETINNKMKIKFLICKLMTINSIQNLNIYLLLNMK